MTTQSNNNIEKSPSLAEVKLKYKNNQPIESFSEITSPEKAEQVLREIWDTDSIQLKEEFIVLLLNNAKKLLGWSKISSGGTTATIVDPATVFQVALLANATSIILAHNHPSGNINPSQADKNLTKRIKESGKMLGISVEDHLILTLETCISFREKEIIW
ncbi:DNA repair protein radc [Fodinibius roseus]|uniref:DNA repair protein radc n=1 Tax=Fodinibius roseus TaxID=1194090 RepID=A0A1M5IAI0_9BACT|nr:JAB domain-containing protein [Fodinibius roseus]SHG24783.1 DNA repair protein radc [Fodinibius roseus]